MEDKQDLFKKPSVQVSFVMLLNAIHKKVRFRSSSTIGNLIRFRLGYRTLVDSQVVYIHPSSSIYHRQPEWYDERRKKKGNFSERMICCLGCVIMN